MVTRTHSALHYQIRLPYIDFADPHHQHIELLQNAV